MWNRTCCAVLFTCNYLHDFQFTTEETIFRLKAQFHALSSQHELYGHARRLSDMLHDVRPDIVLGGRAGNRDYVALRVYDGFAAALDGCQRAANATLARGGGECCDPRRPAARATVVGLWHVHVYTDDEFMMPGMMEQYTFYRDEPERWRGVAAIAGGAIGGTFPWCFPHKDAECPTESIYRMFAPVHLDGTAGDGGGTVIDFVHAAGRRGLKWHIYPIEADLDGLVELHLVRESERDPRSCLLHIYTLMFYRSGYWLLPQFFRYFKNRFGDRVCFTVFDTDLSDGTLGDGRLEHAIDADATIVLIRMLALDPSFAPERVARLLEGMFHPGNWTVTSGVPPSVGAGVRNHFWKRLRDSAPGAWALLCDLDEFVDVSPAKLELWDRVGVNVARTVGYNMVGASRDLTRIHRGRRDARFNKVCLLKPDEVDELHSNVGNHDAYPEPAETLVWGSTALYHMRYVVPDPFGDFVAPGEKAHTVWESLHPGCGVGYDAYCWLAMNASAVSLFGEGRHLDGLSPFHDFADRDIDPVAAMEDADARGCRIDYLVDGGEVVGDDWRWSRVDTGLRVHPPFLFDSEKYTSGGSEEWVGYRDYLGVGFFEGSML